MNERKYIPPFFLFTKEKNSQVRFRGLLVPGSDKINKTEDLIAIWNNKEETRYQNYKSVFTILDISETDREWINDLREGNGCISKYAPIVWENWIKDGKYAPLCSKKTVKHRKNQNRYLIIRMI